MKKYLRFMAFAMTAVFSLAVVSCGEDETEPNEPNNPNTPGGSSTSVQIGVLEGDDAAANAAVADLRLAATTSNSYYDSYSYTYDENGNLESISNMQESWTAQAKDDFKVVMKDDNGSEWEEITITFNISNNRITSLTFDDIYGDSDDEVEDKYTMNYTYNEKGQVSSMTYTGTWREIENGEIGEEGTDKGTMTFIYSSDNRLTFIKSEAKTQYYDAGEDHQYQDEFKETYEYEYSSERPNTFYQYTQMQAYAMDLLDELNPFAYAGLFGKASSYIPTKCSINGWENHVGEKPYGEEPDWSYDITFSCTFNSNGTISSADGYDYVYTNVGTRSVFETNEPAWGQTNAAKRRRIPLHTRMKSMRERHHQLNGK